MAIQQAGKPSEQPKFRRFPRWLRPVFIVLGLVSLALLGFFWIRGVGSDLDKAMTALFVTLTAMFAFLAMPFLYHSEQSQPSNPPETQLSPSSPFSPAQITINNNNYAQQPSSPPAQVTSSGVQQQTPIPETKPETYSQPQQQPLEYKATSNFPVPTPFTPTAQIKLANEERLKLTDALLEVYPEQEDFEMMLEVRCEKKLNTLVDGYSNYRMRIYRLLERTQAEGWTHHLIVAAHEERPRNSALQNWLQR